MLRILSHSSHLVPLSEPNRYYSPWQMWKKSQRCHGSSDVLRSTTRGRGRSRRDGTEKPVRPEIHPHTQERKRGDALQYMLSTPTDVEGTWPAFRERDLYQLVWFGIPSNANFLWHPTSAKIKEIRRWTGARSRSDSQWLGNDEEKKKGREN